MFRPAVSFAAAIAISLGLASTWADVTFRSDVSLVRVDAQVVDRDNRAITGLTAQDFVLREEGRPMDIKNFAKEDMPVDIVLLLDVSGSMGPHVQTLVNASHDALQVLGKDDRVAIMVFDRSTRVRMPFRNSREDITRELDNLVRQETFNGGTDITRGLLDAAAYIGREGRKDARRAIVIMTDDQTERDRDEAKVLHALTRADAVLSALIAPDAMAYRQRGSRRGGYPSGGGGYPGGGYPRGGGGWPGIGGPLGGIIFGSPRYPGGGGYPRGGGGYPGGGGPIIIGGHTHSAGTEQIARSSGGDSMPVDDAYSFQNTLERLRQRYALHFNLPDGVKPGEERNIEVALTDAAYRRYPGAEVRFRRAYQAPGGTADTPASMRDEQVAVTRDPGPGNRTPAPAADNGSVDQDDQAPKLRRRPAVDDGATSGPRSEPSIFTPDPPQQSPQATAQSSSTATQQQQSDDQQPRRRGGWRRVDEPDPTQPNPNGGWRKVKPVDEQ